MHKKVKKYSEVIRETLDYNLKKNKKIILMGLGVDDPKGIFGTTLNLHKKYKNRVFDLPTAENAFTGFALGLSINGFFPVITHQRVEFSLLAFEQFVNQIAKWNFMTAGKVSNPMIIRLIIGKGWGQGPQHSQSLEILFSHIPGVRVIAPSSPESARGLFNSSFREKKPTIIFEHRWLHETYGNVPKINHFTKIGKAKVLRKGKDITLVGFSYSVINCLESAKILENFNISAEVIDLQSLRPLDINTILTSVKKTKKIIIVDNGWSFYGISAEISAQIAERLKKLENLKIIRLGNKNTSIPSSNALARLCYVNPYDVVLSTEKMFKKKFKNLKKFKLTEYFADQPNKNFLGPF